MELKQALEEIRKAEKRKFEQTIDLIVNLKGVDLKKESINVVANVPHKIRDKKVCGFLTKKYDSVHTVTEPEFQKYKDQKALKELVKSYDFFIASAPLMPKVATVFGKVLGPAGKMPSPQLGVLMQENEKTIEEVLKKISNSMKLRAKEASIKLPVGKENMKDEEIIENIDSVYKGIVNVLPNKKENVKNVMIKLTMGKPVKVEIK